MTDIDRAQWLSVIDSRDGRAVMLWILAQCRYDQASFSQDDRTTSRNEGMRAVGIALRARIESADPHGWLKLVKQEIENADLKRNASSPGNGANASNPARDTRGRVVGTVTPG